MIRFHSRHLRFGWGSTALWGSGCWWYSLNGFLSCKEDKWWLTRCSSGSAGPLSAVLVSNTAHNNCESIQVALDDHSLSGSVDTNSIAWIFSLLYQRLVARRSTRKKREEKGLKLWQHDMWNHVERKPLTMLKVARWKHVLDGDEKKAIKRSPNLTKSHETEDD